MLGLDVNIKTGHYKNNHDTRDYFITFEYNAFYMRSVDNNGTERKYKIDSENIYKSILWGCFYLVEEITKEIIEEKEKIYKQHSTRKSSSKSKSGKGQLGFEF